MRYEIIIAEDLTGTNPNIYLDTFDDESISLNYNIADIADIANKNSSYSKTIKLPDTGTNRKAFTDIFNIESTSPYWADNKQFNPNKKVKCWLLKDTLIQFVGNIQLTNVVYEYDTQSFYYECVIYAENDGLFKVIGDTFLSDLDLSAFDHLWSYNNIVQSWTDDYRRGYYYPLIDYGMALNLQYLQSGSRNSTNFLPAIYVKTVVNQIFTEAGFTYKSDFFDEDTFNNLILPFNNKNLIPSYPDLFYAKNGVVSAVGLSSSIDLNTNTIGNVDWANLGFNSVIYDPNNFYSTGVYRNGLTASTTQRFSLYLSILMTAGNIATDEAPWQSWSDNIRVWCTRSKFPDGTNVPGWSATPTYFEFTTYPRITWDNGQDIRQLRSLVDDGAWEKIDVGNNNYVIRGKINTSYFFPPLRKNEEVRFFITRSINNQAANPATIVGTASFFQSEVNLTQASEDAFLEMRNVVPTNVKQKDFLASIIRMFNLVVEPDTDIDNNFIIEPKDYYYKKYSVFKDWSQKLDLNASVNAQLLSNTQTKTNLFTYKADKDFYNQKYTETDSKVFGEYRYDIDNDFLSGDKKIEVIFSPTPLNELAPIGSGIYLPSIYQMNNGNITKMEGMNLRVLYKSPIALTASNYIKLNGNLQSIYPYAGYVDNPLNPSMSLNFGDVNSFYTGYTETQNNLFYNYYQRTIDLLQDRYAKLVVAEINLDAFDINTFRFSDLIYLTIGGMSGYYRVNKIIDYDPSKEQPTRVEFITALNYNNGLTIEDTCNVVMTKILTGTAFSDYSNTVDSYYADPIYHYITFTTDSVEDFSGTYYTLDIQGVDPDNLMDNIASWASNVIPGMVATYIPGLTQCTLNFEVEMGVEATNVFLTVLSDYWYESPENGGVGPDPYIAIYIDYPCGATYSDWEEFNNVYFWNLDGGNDQYTFLDWWLTNIPGSYGTASGGFLEEDAYLKIGWDWVTDCDENAGNETTCDFTWEINYDAAGAVNFLNHFITAGGGAAPYLVFGDDYSQQQYSFGIVDGGTTMQDIVDWANTYAFMSATSSGGGYYFYYSTTQLCGGEGPYRFKMGNSGYEDGPLQIAGVFEQSTTSDYCYCPPLCFGEGLQLYIAKSSVDYLPGGWGPDLFVTEAILGPTSGIVYDQGGLTYGPPQDICECQDETLSFVWTKALPCPGGELTMYNYISTPVGNEIAEMLFTATDDCFCDTVTLGDINYTPQVGSTIPVSQDIVWVGNINTNPSNIFNDVNNIVVGRDNFIDGSNNSVTGNRNAVSGNSNIVSGEGNSSNANNVFIMGASISNSYTTEQPSFLFGTNIENYSNGSFLVGNNIQVGVGTNSNTISATGSTTSPPPSNLFLVGSNITITDANTIPSDTTYLGSENIILSPDGGFNTPFIISEAVSTTALPTGQSIIKTYTGFYTLAPNTSEFLLVYSDVNRAVAEQDFFDMPLYGIVYMELNIRLSDNNQTEFTTRNSIASFYKTSNVVIEAEGMVNTNNTNTFWSSQSPQNYGAYLVVGDDLTPGQTQPLIALSNFSLTDTMTAYWDITLKYQYE